MNTSALRVGSGQWAAGSRLRGRAWSLSAGQLVLPLVLLAAALRLPQLQTVPELTDEMRDAIFSLPIARGQSLPLVNFSAYDGALFNYLQATVFRLIGPDPRAPRVMMLLFGLLTVPVVYLCVRRAYGVTAAILAVAMLAVSPVHVVVNSRVAWGNCLTPLLTTVGFWLIYKTILPGSSHEGQAGVSAPASRRWSGEEAGRAWSLAPAGLFFGLGLQTHPTVFGLLPGAALAVAIARPKLLKTCWPWLGVLGFVLGYANVLVFNVRQDFESIRFAQRTRAEYTGLAPDFGREYLTNLGTLLTGLYRMTGGAVEDRASPNDFLVDPTILGAALVAFSGIVWAAHRGDSLPLLVILGDVLFLPLANDRYEPILDGRYLAPLLPLIFGASAAMLISIWPKGNVRGARRVVRQTACLLGIACLLVTPLVGLARFNQQMASVAQRMGRLWAALELAEQQHPPDMEVILDRDLEHAGLGAGSTELLAFEYAFTMHDVPYRMVRVTPGGLVTTLSSESAAPRMVIMERTKRKLLDPRVKLRQLDSEPNERPDRSGFAFGVYLASWAPAP